MTQAVTATQPRPAPVGRLRGWTAVVTGASSGIGRATALELARQGASVCVSARRAEPLDDLVDECRRLGATAVAVVCDVTDPEQVTELTRLAGRELGHIDAWVNNAGVTAIGLFEETPPEAWNRVLETNLLGYVNAARAVLPHFRERGRGVLINNASMVARLAEPYATAYVASKHAVRGFGQSLRQELYLTGARDIHVCTVLPAVIDTPFFQHAANYAGVANQAPSPVYPPERVARTIARLVRAPKREVFVGTAGPILALLSGLAPSFVERLMARSGHKHHFDRRVAVEPNPGNLFVPMKMTNGHATHGGWQPRGPSRAVRAGGIGVLAVALPLAGWALWRAGRRRWG